MPGWRLVENRGVYVNKDLEEKMEKLKEWMDDGEKGVRVLKGGYFNARTEREAGELERRGGGKKEEVEG